MARRPLPLAAAAENPAPTVGLVGDSVPFQSLFDLADTLGADRKIAFVYAGLGLEIRDVLPPTRDAIRGDQPPDVFLVFIGTHQSNTDPPAIWRAELRRLLTLVSRRVDCIRVFEIDDTDTGFYRRHDRQAATYNRITRQVTEEYATAEWYHYDAWADRAGPEFERPDILHHNERGALALARLMQAVANSCDPALTSGPFWDVPDDHPAAEAIAWVGDQGLFGGTPTTPTGPRSGRGCRTRPVAPSRRWPGNWPGGPRASTTTRGPTAERPSTPPSTGSPTGVCCPGWPMAAGGRGGPSPGARR